VGCDQLGHLLSYMDASGAGGSVAEKCRIHKRMRMLTGQLAQARSPDCAAVVRMTRSDHRRWREYRAHSLIMAATRVRCWLAPLRCLPFR
jgi:hypothetical protein